MGFELRPSRACFEHDLAELLRVTRRLRAAEIDAGACGTRSDFDKLHKLEADYEQAVENFTEKYAPAEQAGTRG